jgi:hypothetical protein
MSTEPLFLDLLLEAARTLHATVTLAPAPWTGSEFNAEVLDGAASGAVSQRQSRDLPEVVAAFRIDDTPLLIGSINGPADLKGVEEQLRRYRNQAALARSWLGTEGPNLQLFLTGPPGAVTDGRWRQAAAVVEADDRVCRKLMWLFGTNPTIEDATTFLGRSFMATPWDKEERVRQKLDLMTDFGLPEGWQAVVDDEALDAEGLVNALVALEGEI